MEVINEKSAYLCNFEVLQKLKSIKGKVSNIKNAATVIHEAIDYFDDKACINQTPEKIQNFLKAVQPFNLTKCEKLTIINIAPTSAIELQVIVEDAEERLGESEVDGLLQIIETHLGDPEKSKDSSP